MKRNDDDENAMQSCTEGNLRRRRITETIESRARDSGGGGSARIVCLTEPIGSSSKLPRAPAQS